MYAKEELEATAQCDEALERARRSALLEELHKRHAKELLRLVRARVANTAVAEEIVQETFVRAWRSIETVDWGRAGWAWLATVARNLCTDSARRAVHRETERLEDLTDDRLPIALWAGNPEDRYVEAERWSGATAALRSLPDNQRRLLFLRVIDGYGHDDLAHMEGMSVPALKSALRRARVRARTQLAAFAGEGIGAPALVVLARLRRLRVVLDRARARAARSMPLTGVNIAIANAPAMVGAVAVGAAVVAASPAAASPWQAAAFARPAPAATPAATMRPSLPVASRASGSSSTAAGGSRGSAPRPVVPARPATPAQVSVTRGPDHAAVNGSVKQDAPTRDVSDQFWATVDCSYSKVRKAICDSVPSVPSLPSLP